MSLEPCESSLSELEHHRLLCSQQISSLLEATGRNPSELGRLLEACRGYLLIVANEELASDVRPKVSNSDLVQQTLVEAYQGFNGFRGNTSAELLAWLRRVLINNVVDTARGFRDTEKRALHREVSLEKGNSEHPLVAGLVTTDPSPSRRAMAAEEHAALFQALAKLPPRDQQVIRLRNWEQLSFAEIGRQLATTEEAARKIWTRAVKRLARELRQSQDPSQGG